MNEQTILNKFYSQCRYSKLYKAIYRQSKLELSEVIDNLDNHNICDANNGFASGFIYYKDTIPFGKKHFTDAVKLFNYFDFSSNDCLAMFFNTDNEIDYNKVSFFLYECFIIDLVHYLQELKSKGNL